ncbi:putative quinol monooxygenase [Paramicrobacterium fandaimingii]|uniref:putative quinol monooxygenase n=1 Tax=Paramicrobacterium fandaimingii TaxID=2708079 RepID=UPI0014234704|nr:antibiotic biosynthesis monooxygenase [Microbacterium fandaimingii]
MSCVELRGRLVCANRAEASTIERHLARHIELTRAEPGCLSFEVRPTGDPLVWTVAEKFAGQESFAAHQTRVAVSEWGRATAGIKRDYTVSTGGREPAPAVTDELDMGPQT